MNTKALMTSPARKLGKMDTGRKLAIQGEVTSMLAQPGLLTETLTLLADMAVKRAGTSIPNRAKGMHAAQIALRLRGYVQAWADASDDDTRALAHDDMVAHFGRLAQFLPTFYTAITGGKPVPDMDMADVKRGYVFILRAASRIAPQYVPQELRDDAAKLASDTQAQEQKRAERASARAAKDATPATPATPRQPRKAKASAPATQA